MKLPYLLGFLLLSTSATFCSVTAYATQTKDGKADQKEAEQLFTLEVLPTLKEKCFGCHGANEDEIKGEYDVTSLGSLLEGGESGDAAIVVGQPDESPLYWAVCWENGLEMPPKENDRLSDEQVKSLRQWIQLGAHWPNEERQAEIQKAAWAVTETAAGKIVQTSGGLSDQWTYRRYAAEDLWAWQPMPKRRSNPRSIDDFITRKLAEAGFEPAEQADPKTLIRRATYDLHGLPPTPAEVQSFVKEWQADAESAWQTLVNRLLDNPRYGERWGQHWLDIARYADTGGYSNDYERSNAWRYRDYVVRSLNEDKPYDQFCH